MLLGTWLFVEILSYVILLALYGGWATIEGMHDEARTDGVRSAGIDLMDAVVHPYLGYVRRPSQDPEELPPEERINAYGFRDVQSSLHRRAKDRFIVGVLGGSVAEEFGMTGMETLQRELERAPKFAGKTVVPVRLGIAGFKQPQQLLAVIYLLSLRGEFDAIVNIDGLNEVMLPKIENAPQRAFPAYPRSWRLITMGAGDVDILRKVGRITYFKSIRRRMATWLVSTWAAKSPTLNLLWIPIDETLRKVMVDDYRLLNVPANPKEVSPLSGPQFEFSDDELYEFCVAVWKESSQQLQRVCDANDIRYYHVLQPNQYVTGTKTMSAEEEKVAIDHGFVGRTAIQTGYPLLMSAGKELAGQGVRFHDLTRLFVDHPEPIYRDDCCHYNQHGNELLAREIARIIAESF